MEDGAVLAFPEGNLAQFDSHHPLGAIHIEVLEAEFLVELNGDKV